MSDLDPRALDAAREVLTGGEYDLEGPDDWVEGYEQAMEFAYDRLPEAIRAYLEDAEINQTIQTLAREVRHLREQKESLIGLLNRLYALCMFANDGAFENGVKDSSGTRDEGDVVAGKILDEVREILYKE